MTLYKHVDDQNIWHLGNTSSKKIKLNWNLPDNHILLMLLGDNGFLSNELNCIQSACQHLYTNSPCHFVT